MEILRARGNGKLQGRSRFTGKVWINEMKSVPLRVLYVRFAPRARSFWHNHPSGQVLIVLSGRGRVGVETRSGKQKVRQIRQRDTVIFAPGEIHWHGAAPNQEMVHIALHFNSDFTHKRRVSEKEYNLRKERS